MPAPDDITIAPFDPAAATDEEHVDFNALTNRIRSERDPEEPPLPLAVTRGQIENLPAGIEARFWFARSSDGALVGMAQSAIMTTGDNDHLAHFDIEVVPERRQQGLGRALLGPVVDFAEQAGRRLLLAGASEAVPASSAFLGRIGAAQAAAQHVNRLRLAAVDVAMVDAWVKEGEATPGYRLEWLDGPIPDDRLDEMARVFELMNTQPFDDIEYHDEHLTPERLAANDQALFAQEVERWIAVVRHEESGDLAGFTEVTWRPQLPKRIDQGGTAVDPAHRGHGLGKWLKAAMAARVLSERPQADNIRTGNADSNDAMLAINRRLGFEPHLATSLWQVEVAAVRTYLSGD